MVENQQTVFSVSDPSTKTFCNFLIVDSLFLLPFVLTSFSLSNQKFILLFLRGFLYSVLTIFGISVVCSFHVSLKYVSISLEDKNRCVSNQLKIDYSFRCVFV